MNTIQKATVSIIIPYYNSMEFIGDCLNSVLSQSYTNLEIIIINDGSDTENTGYLETLLQDKRIVYLKNDSKQGVAYSRNKGLSSVTGELVFFLDSEDILAENSIEFLVAHIKEAPAIAGKTKRLLKPTDLEIPQPPEVMVIDQPSPIIFNSGSILNVLIRNSFIKERSIRFYEETEGATDISGIIPFILYVKSLPCLNIYTYFQRVRNDPISNPSLVQRSIQERTRDFIKIYMELTKQYGKSELVKEYLDGLLLRFYRRQVINIFQDKKHFDEFFALLSSAMKEVNPATMASQPRHIKREINQLRSGSKDKFIKGFRFHVEVRDFKNAIKGFTRLKRYIYNKFFLRFPMKENYIIFESFLGKNYSDSPRNIYEYIMENKLDYQCIWVFNDKNRKIPGNAKIVKRFSLAYYYYFAVSKYWINNMRQPLHLVKREGNVFLETWHGTPLKKLVFDMKDVYSANPRYKRDFYMQSRAWDYLLSPNRYSSEIFRSAFKFDNEMLEYGYPRNDILYSLQKEEIVARVKKNIGIPDNKKVVLYAPTWRDDDYYEPGKYKFQLQLDLHKMKETLGDDYVVALRMHYFIADDINVEGLDGFAFNLSKYDDIAELYLISDILITDYSSVFFDYANLKRPILFFTYDLDKYRDQLRGFYLDFENEGPGPLLKTSDAVIEAISNIDEVTKEYAERYDSFYEKFCSWHDGKSTEKVVKRLLINDK
ncbi:bifunctional glycosyltransferase family 2 protein/CDP-glycerol:glycerophosphate glycerophosphotransferase [Bacillus sp. sid0103]|uniref:bifunctional glycosyltransferase/CDP-glycerol:glycerophosphate glycerophosphotransferase n=1 Tax=Bacillus sp. sid0103 TaxID=2856337 RepID=UPI001C48313A|nr:bifunctional glycosyltransferase family 2 protein/CDP-glycerol:glycerophosphate glycerophosphotransferase [Bacillus sp. sid0103]MBV7505708.1 bifunctional glycosyltransferase family 2 protein/CDP-glycerol:glycerophosphate glycerophosphotransferase [Bacillus sp. sid0103]